MHAEQQALAGLREREPAALLQRIETELGPPGRMISASKSGYCRRHPDHLVVWNGNLLVDGRKVWWGDLDLTADEPTLRRRARHVGEIHVLHEHDGRFQHESSPLTHRAVYWTYGHEGLLGDAEAGAYEFHRGCIRRTPQHQPGTGQTR